MAPGSLTVFGSLLLLLPLASATVIFNQQRFNGQQQTWKISPPLASATVISNQQRFNDCHERWLSGEREPGVYHIHPVGLEAPVQVFCNHTSSNSFTIIQRRVDNTQSFEQNYEAYRRGFGNRNTNFWAGLDAISALTYSGNSILRVDLADWTGQQRFASYKRFLVDPAHNYYRLTVYGYTGTSGDDMSFSNGCYFYTADRPDAHYCAVNMPGGWWFNYCAYANPNGRYYHGYYTPNSHNYYDGVFWKSWYDFNYSLRFVQMSLQHV